MNLRIAILLIFSLAAIARAQPHRDVHVYTEAGQLRTGVVDFDNSGDITPDVRVFPGFFGETANGTNDPGFNASPGTFASGSLLSFNILDALRKWDGTDFDTIPPERLFISLGATNRQTPTTADAFVAGFNITAVLSNGSFHQHINYFLTTPFSAGVYLLKIEVRVGSGDPSPPIYIVFRQGSDQMAHQAAIAYVESTLIAPPICVGDANDDRDVNFADITSVLASFGLTGEPGFAGDADRSGSINFADITFVLSNWGNSCP